MLFVTPGDDLDPETEKPHREGSSEANWRRRFSANARGLVDASIKLVLLTYTVNETPNNSSNPISSIFQGATGRFVQRIFRS